MSDEYDILVEITAEEMKQAADDMERRKKEAADTIEALRAENARLKEEYEQALQMCMNQARTLKRWSDMNEKLREALKRVLSDIEEYERVNNLAPNPGREHCWDSVRAARTAIGETE